MPGLKQASYTLEFFKRTALNTPGWPEISFHISGKWFNYSTIVLVMVLDLK